MINESPKEVKAYWFFTFKTLPDEELLAMLNTDKHEVALHIVNSPYEEKKMLEKASGRPLRYYTIHGTSRLLGRIIWGRWKSKAPEIPQDFPLQSFHQFPTFALDSYRYKRGPETTIEAAEESIKQEKIIEIHPDWLFQRGTINHRGPYYEVIRRILNVNEEFKGLKRRKKMGFWIAHSSLEYEKDVRPTEKFLEKLREKEVDIFTFIERRWQQTLSHTAKNWTKANDNIALLQVSTYDEWWKAIGKKTRNMVRKAEKSGVTTKIVVADENLVEGIWKIYNEIPIRQGRAFPHYGAKLKAVKRIVRLAKNSTFIGSYIGDELAGFIQLIHGDNIAIISQILSLQKQWDKAVNNALLAKAVEVCADKQVKWLMYGRMGNHPSLDKFKQNNGFTCYPLTRYYIPLTRKGRIAAKLRLHREKEDMFPQSIRDNLIRPIYSWINRTKNRKKRENSQMKN
jgi:hypothetical protein